MKPLEVTLVYTKPGESKVPRLIGTKFGGFSKRDQQLLERHLTDVNVNMSCRTRRKANLTITLLGVQIHTEFADNY